MMPAKETLQFWLLPAVAGTACLVGLGAWVWRGQAKPEVYSSVNTASAVDVARAVAPSPPVSEPPPPAGSGGHGGPPLLRASRETASKEDPERGRKSTALSTARVEGSTDPRVVLLLDTKADDTARNEAAVALRQAGYKGLVGDCLTVLNNPEEKERFRSFVVQYLGQSLQLRRDAPLGAEASGDAKATPTQDRILAVLHEALSDRHTSVRREALLALVRLRDPEGIATVHRWLHDAGPDADAPALSERGGAERVEGMLDLAIRCTQELDLRDEIDCLRLHARDGNEVIRIAALVALSQWGDEESRAAFQDAAQSNSIRLQRAGKTALARLDRLKAEPNPARSE